MKLETHRLGFLSEQDKISILNPYSIEKPRTTLAYRFDSWFGSLNSFYICCQNVFRAYNNCLILVDCNLHFEPLRDGNLCQWRDGRKGHLTGGLMRCCSVSLLYRRRWTLDILTSLAPALLNCICLSAPSQTNGRVSVHVLAQPSCQSSWTYDKRANERNRP